MEDAGLPRRPVASIRTRLLAIGLLIVGGLLAIPTAGSGSALVAPSPVWIGVPVALAALVLSEHLGGSVTVGGNRITVSTAEIGLVVAIICVRPVVGLSVVVLAEAISIVRDRQRTWVSVLNSAVWFVQAALGILIVHWTLEGLQRSAPVSHLTAWAIALAASVGVPLLGPPIWILIARVRLGRRSSDAMLPALKATMVLTSVGAGAAGYVVSLLLVYSPWSLCALAPALLLQLHTAGQLVSVRGQLQRTSLGRRFLAALNRADEETPIDDALEELRELLNIRFVTLRAPDGSEVFTAAAADATFERVATTIDLAHESQPLGTLLVGPKRNGDPFDEADHETLESNAGQLATWLAKWKLAAQVEYMATHDQLTGLLNRIGLDQRISADASSGITTGAVMLLDLDNFRQLNDTLGHHAGDELLDLVAMRIRSVVGTDAALARLGGDEFAVWLPAVDIDGMAQVAADVLEAINEPVEIHNNPLHIEGSIGVASYPDHGDNTTDLIRRADVAMYMAKDAHLGVMRYDPALDPHSAERLRVLGELRTALTDGALIVHYQPKYELATNRIVGVESLVRWQQPDGRMIPPGMFIDAAERSGLIGPIFELVLRTSLLQIRTWDRMGLSLTASVNMSARNLADPSVIETIERALVDYGVPAHQLTIELTERDLPANSGSAAAMLRYLTSIGVAVSLDDFGTGQQSYVHLTQLPIDEIKIDQTFVKKIASSPLNQGIVESLVHVARRGRLHAVAEGIEDEQTLDLLREMGCQYGQGYHLCRPAGADVITEVILTNAAELSAVV